MLFKPIALGYRSISEGNRVAGEPGPLSGQQFIVTTSSISRGAMTYANKPLLKAGMPIVVDLVEWEEMRGETTTMSALGTITYVDDNGRIFAFGHPFYNARNVVYSFRTCEVMGTVFSQGGSFKLVGKTSEILGAITSDSANGIYGSISLDDLDKLHRFNLELKVRGKLLNRFDIKVADSFLTPYIAKAAFGIIGKNNGAPRSQETSMTQLKTKVGLEGRDSIVWNELFASEVTKFGPFITYTSSYDAAFRDFFAKIYNLLSENEYGLKISNVFVSADFIPGKSQIFKLGAYKFPRKIVWGQNPTLEILLVSQHNSIAIAKKIPVEVDWDKVEKPVYTKDTSETDKVHEKIISGLVRITSTKYFFQGLSSDERQRFMPEYFLGADDFLENLSRILEATNQKLFAKVIIRSKSGSDEEAAKVEDIMPDNISEDTGAGWHIIDGGLTKRKTTPRNQNQIVSYINLPQVPGGVVDQGIDEGLRFEIVLEGSEDDESLK